MCQRVGRDPESMDKSRIVTEVDIQIDTIRDWMSKNGVTSKQLSYLTSGSLTGVDSILSGHGRLSTLIRVLKFVEDNPHLSRRIRRHDKQEIV